MRDRYVSIPIPPGMWKEYRLDDPFMYQLTLSSYYLGYGPLTTRGLVMSGPREEQEAVVETAMLLGLDLKLDRLYKSK